ncbi:MAG: xanthine dehydrogenase family protein molybdopterin-binding subunit [Alphaproteobacteria bacterium]|nr:xanthine dehydrogenase family protein molybdopterin-binding subunit [Alphaproteobacteria bacterium]
MAKFGMGQSVRRVEDARFITGAGRYNDDINLPGQCYAFFLRSPHAHARIKSIDVGAAKRVPGILGVFTGADVKAAGLGDMPCDGVVPNRDGSKMQVPPRPIVAVDTVRFVGDTVAIVVGETLAAARDAAETIEVDYDPLPAVVDTKGALAGDAPQVWPFAKKNLAVDWGLGDEAATDAAFKKAARIISVDLINNRVVPNSMEPRGALGDFAAGENKFTLYTSSQGGHTIRKTIAKDIFHVPESSLRVVTGDVGGGFGMKIFPYPEYAGVLFAARALKRPVKWTPDRSDAFLTDTHGRDNVTRGELAIDKDGKFLALRVEIVANLGAYLSHYGPFIPTFAGAKMHNGVYGLSAIYIHVLGVYTHTAPVDAYRGAGRPEANYLVERLVDVAARETGLGPVEIRRRNFIPPSAMPYTTAAGAVYDSGEFARNLDDALKAIDWQGFPQRRAESERAGKLRGIGLATYIEACGGAPDETAEIHFMPAGEVHVLVGNQSNGQGHETAYMQLIHDRLGIDFDKIKVIQGDTDQIQYGRGTGGSRALSVGGGAIVNASELIVTKGKKIAGHLMETSEADIEFANGQFVVAGTDRAMSIFDVAAAARDPKKLPVGMAPGLDEKANYNPADATYPNGCHIVEVEIDAATGVPRIVNYVIVDDFGKVINPMLVAGQVHGGTVQGIGQALLEGCQYDPASGQLLTGSFMDYCMPRADDVPSFNFAYNEVPCAHNVLGVKGAGEAGSMGAPPAVINAIVDALQPYGVRHIDMPATAERIWRLIERKTPRAAE